MIKFLLIDMFIIKFIYNVFLIQSNYCFNKLCIFSFHTLRKNQLNLSCLLNVYMLRLVSTIFLFGLFLCLTDFAKILFSNSFIIFVFGVFFILEKYI